MQPIRGRDWASSAGLHLLSFWGVAKLLPVTPLGSSVAIAGVHGWSALSGMRHRQVHNQR